MRQGIFGADEARATSIPKAVCKERQTKSAPKRTAAYVIEFTPHSTNLRSCRKVQSLLIVPNPNPNPNLAIIYPPAIPQEQDFDTALSYTPRREFAAQ